MKKLIILLAAILILLPLRVDAFDAVGSGGIGWLQQNGTTSELGYHVGFGVPIVSKSEAGYKLITQTDYLYSGYSDNIRALRIYLINKKAVITRPDYGFYVALGAGSWAFLTDEESQSLGAFMATIGGNWKFIEVKLSAEVVQLVGPDLFYPNIGVVIGL
jgi:hypothetical protein